MLSIVVPVFNERESLPLLHRELSEVTRAQGWAIEVIFVDDGSTDGSWQSIVQLAASDPRVQGIRFRRNFGKAAALSAGFASASGDRVVTLDADLQDNPGEIPALLAALDGDCDLVSGWKQVRHDPWHKVWPSRVFNWMVSTLSGVKLHDHNCGMKGYRREVLSELQIYGELHRFVPVLAAARGFRVGEVVVRHRARQFGHSKYGVQRFLKGFLDLLTVSFLTRFGRRPQHLLGAIGMTSLALGMLGILYALARSGVAGETTGAASATWAAMAGLALMVMGVQLVATGLLAELVVAQHGRAADEYSIVETTAGSARRGATPAGEVAVRGTGKSSIEATISSRRS